MLKRFVRACGTVCVSALVALVYIHSFADAQALEPGLTGRVIVLDAGHGGPDGGARTPDGRNEKDITLAIAKRTAEYLRQAGAIVYMTRETDHDLATDIDRLMGRRQAADLRKRVLIAKAKKPDAFISIHCNAVPSPQWRGAQTIYMEGNAEGKHLAHCLQESFRSLLLPTTREPDDMNTLYLLRRIHGPAVLAEVGFLSNPDEAEYLCTPQYQQQVALSLYVGVLTYFGENAHHGDS